MELVIIIPVAARCTASG